MNHRFLRTAGAVAITISVVLLAPATLGGGISSFVAAVEAADEADQAAGGTTKAKGWAPPKTAWGDPDLQGVWTNATITPFERPKELTGKEVLSDAEAAEFEQRTNERNSIDRPPPPGNPGGYNQFWFDRGTRMAGRQTSLVVDPSDGRVPPLTPDAQKRTASRAEYLRSHPADTWSDLSLFTRCLTRGMPGAMTPGFYNHNYQIFQAPGYVAILIEMIHEARIIPLDGRAHVAQNVHQWMGDPRGRWEGNTLVVETTNFHPQAQYRGASTNLRLVERYTRVDADTIHYEFSVHDPTTFTKSWTAAIPMTQEGAPKYIYEYACHEGNYGIVNILAGHRAEEKAAEASSNKPR